MPNEVKALMLVHAAATLIMTGVIWAIQLVHYPLFRYVGAADFVRYEAAHMGAITCLVLPLMLAELLTGGMLAFTPTPGISPLVWWAGAALIGVVWVTTGLVNVPQHSALSLAFDADVHHALVTSNWIRTIAWSLRSAIVIGVVWVLVTVSST